MDIADKLNRMLEGKLDEKDVIDEIGRNLEKSAKNVKNENNKKNEKDAKNEIDKKNKKDKKAEKDEKAENLLSKKTAISFNFEVLNENNYSYID